MSTILFGLNLPMNESGVVGVGECRRIPLGYRVLLPHGFVGVMKERMSVIEEMPFHVLAGMIDSNTMREDVELHPELGDELLRSELRSDLGKEVEVNDLDIRSVPDSRPLRLHPELVLFVHNCGTKPLVYTKGKSIVQLFVQPICESQIRLLTCDEHTTTNIPLRYALTKTM